ncbi:MAG: glycosyltransferase, partial [Thermoanaerobaculia bacterium]
MPSLTRNELPPAPPGKSGWPWTDGAHASREVPPDRRSWPRISLVTPSLNQGTFVEAAIRSVLLQGYPNVELIVVDGGSTDGSVDTIAKYARWLAHSICESDSGPANALNKGFRLATGDILGFLNADDFLLPECLATVAREFWMHPGVDVISGHGFMAKAS